MRRWLRRIWEDWTYMDLSGRRRMRRAAKAGLALLLALIPLGVLALYQRARVMAVVHATPAPLLLPTRTPTPVPAPTPTPPTDAAGCPTDPGRWRLVEYAGLGNLRGIDPPCVYDQIARTAAWHLLLRMGYTVPEANQALGFARIPQIWTDVLTVTTHGKTGLVVPVTGQQLEDPELRQWALNRQRRPSAWIVLRGCSRGRDNGLPWPVVCNAWAGSLEQAYIVALLEDLGVLARPNHPSHAYPIEFGYVGDGEWAYLGAHAHPDGRLYVLLTDTARIREALPRLSDPLPVEVWDAAWLKKAFGLEMKPLPEGWEGWTDRSRELWDRLGRRRSLWEPGRRTYP